MKRQWQARRATQPHPDGQRRGGQAYQHLLRWAHENEAGRREGAAVAQPEAVRHEHARGDLRPGLDGEPGPGADDCAAAAAPAGACSGAGLADVSGLRQGLVGLVALW